MTATHTGTCEQSTSCNLYVVMVLHNPGEQREGGERDVFCDVHWFWSPGHIKVSTLDATLIPTAILPHLFKIIMPYLKPGVDCASQGDAHH